MDDFDKEFNKTSRLISIIQTITFIGIGVTFALTLLGLGFLVFVGWHFLEKVW